MTTDDLRYPIGRFVAPSSTSASDRASAVARLRALPASLRVAVAGLDAAQLDTPYREGGWTVRDVVQHLGDSHLNALARVMLALTEERPVVRLYDETAWVRVGTTASYTIEHALAFMDALQVRLADVADTVDHALGARELEHPQSGIFTLDRLLALYAWHGDHHVAHITRLRERRGW
jgi:hypothetical protein